MWALAISHPKLAAWRELLEVAELRIGRTDENHVVLEQDLVSRRHARIARKDGKFILVDLKSTHGTYVNGRKLTAPLVIRETDRIQIADFTLQITESVELPAPPDLAAHYVAVDAREAGLIRAILDREPGSRLVYADWLEERGDDVRCEFLRVQDALVQMAPDGEAFRDRSHQLAHLAKQIDVAWRVRIARPTIEGCAMDYECPREWGALEATERADVRFCNGCQKTVHYAIDVRAGRELARQGACVAIDLRAPRWKQDLSAPFGRNVCDDCQLDVGPEPSCPACGRWISRQMMVGRMVSR